MAVISFFLSWLVSWVIPAHVDGGYTPVITAADMGLMIYSIGKDLMYSFAVSLL